MPGSFHYPPRSFPAGPAACIALFASLLLQACFSSSNEGESPYSVPAGGYVDQIQLEAAPDGSILLLARVAMLYRHKDPELTGDTSPTTRNYQTILYRRSKESWSPTYFKNIQTVNRQFPVLVPVSGSGFQAFVRDDRVVRRYAMREGAWVPVAKPTMPRDESNIWQADDWNWSRLPMVAMPNDSIMLAIDLDWNYEGYSKNEVREPGRNPLPLGPSFYPRFFQANDRYRAIIGIERDMRDTAAFRSNQTVMVYYHWKPEDSTLDRQYLDSLVGLKEAYYANSYIGDYRGGSAIFVASTGDTCSIIPLKEDGSLDEARTAPNLSEKHPVRVLAFVADDQGCFHRISSLIDSTYTTSSFVHQNTCEAGPGNILNLPEPAPLHTFFAYSFRLRLAPDGHPIAAFILEDQAKDEFGRVVSSTNRLIFAELRDGAWRLETVHRP